MSDSTIALTAEPPPAPRVADTSFSRITPPVRQSRGLPERILVAVHQACDLGAFDIAHALLCVMNDVVRQTSPQSPAATRRAIEGMVAAHHRLWHLRRGAAAHDLELDADPGPDPG